MDSKTGRLDPIYGVCYLEGLVRWITSRTGPTECGGRWFASSDDVGSDLQVRGVGGQWTLDTLVGIDTHGLATWLRGLRMTNSRWESDRVVLLQPCFVELHAHLLSDRARIRSLSAHRGSPSAASAGESRTRGDFQMHFSLMKTYLFWPKVNMMFPLSESR